MLPASSGMALGMAVLSRMDTFFINSMLSTTFEDTTKLFGADDARHIADFPAHLRSLSPLYSSIYLDLPPSSQQLLTAIICKHKHLPDITNIPKCASPRLLWRQAFRPQHQPWPS